MIHCELIQGYGVEIMAKRTPRWAEDALEETTHHMARPVIEIPMIAMCSNVIKCPLHW